MSVLKLILTLLVIGLCESVLLNLNETAKFYRLVAQYHKYKIQSYFQRRQSWITSNLGTFMFKNKRSSYYQYTHTKFIIFLYWETWDWQKYRNLGDVFANCSVKNCRISLSPYDLVLADAVVVHVQRGRLPPTSRRSPYQRWIFMSDESPINMFVAAHPEPSMSQWANVFNWTMTYRTDSDIPIPYGRTIPLSAPLLPSNMPESVKNLIPHWKIKLKNVYVTCLISHCNVKERTDYIKQLQQHIKVDVYGFCSKKHQRRCPGHHGKDCPLINKYLFYLAFENSKCRQYITEKTFYNAYGKGSIPIIMGAPKIDCEKLLPPHSFLHVSNYKSPKELAEDIKRLVKSEEKLLMYHQWRRFFEIKNEHGYFRTTSSHMCRVCEALNYNDWRAKVYSREDLRIFVEPELLCEKPFSRWRSTVKGGML